MQIKKTAFKNWRGLRPRNLEDLEEFQALLERGFLSTKDGGSLQSESLNLTTKEKLPEDDVQYHKHWSIDHLPEDNFESILKWIELRL